MNVVSAGFREGIERLWRREGLPPVPVRQRHRATQRRRRAAVGRVVQHALSTATLRARVVQGRHLRTLRRVGDAVAVFGDGVSDLCLAREADIVFARGMLAELCERESIAYHRLSDYRLALTQLIEWMTPPDNAVTPPARRPAGAPATPTRVTAPARRTP